MTAYWPHRRNSGHDVQSCAIFSGTHMCGTIVNPAHEVRRLVRERAQRRKAARGAPLQPGRSPVGGRAGCRARVASTTSDRTSATLLLSGASSAQPITRPSPFRDNEPRRVCDHSSIVRGSR